MSNFSSVQYLVCQGLAIQGHIVTVAMPRRWTAPTKNMLLCNARCSLNRILAEGKITAVG